ncbi:hypothetical protein HGP28_16045 [Vibrio sp. SM6]|uniref:Uncharacterized protein n=1 Tax=Vibrio agarilyticus TaxID=2726741 RepID=A0A7X8YIH1_9VIBR|nr:hypothetical protein [Vibrio agarilyticus]
MKASELSKQLHALPAHLDPDIVTGENWLPERLVTTQLDDNLLFLHFDSAPEESEGDEARGFVEHEIALIRERLDSILNCDEPMTTKSDALLALFLLGHERSSTEVIEMLEDASEHAFDESYLN